MSLFIVQKVVLTTVVAVACAQREFGFEPSESQEPLGSAPGYKQTPYSDYKPGYTPDYKPPSYAPSYKPSYANGRVKIQAYRGPNKAYGKGDGYGYEDSFAPWGFYVNQPEDDKPYYPKYWAARYINIDQSIVAGYNVKWYFIKFLVDSVINAVIIKKLLRIHAYSYLS